MEEENKQEIVDIHPLKKSRRILVFLADFFINLILSYLIFNIMVAPIGKELTNFEKKNNQHIEATEEMYHHYYKSKIFLKDDSFEEYEAKVAVEYTYRCFLSYYVLDDEESIDPEHPQYGHKAENDTIYHYYIDIREDFTTYYNHFTRYNEKYSYFIFDEGIKRFELKEEVKNELYSYFDPKDEIGDLGQKYYDRLSEDLFNPLMATLLDELDTYDLHYENELYSYIECRKIIKNVEEYHARLMTISAFLSHSIAWAIYFLVSPLINKGRKTWAMMIMKIERVNFYSLNITKRPMYLIFAIYSFFISMMGILFLPSMLVNFNSLFTYTFLLYASLFAIVLALGDLIFLLFNQYNRSLVDFLSNDLYLSEDELNEIYRARGYYI